MPKIIDNVREELLKEAKKHGSFNKGNLFTVQFPSANNENKEKEEDNKK